MAEKYGRCPGIMEGLAILPIERGRHHHHRHALLANQGLDGGYEFEIRAAIGL
jgi:hypothetical protein